MIRFGMALMEMVQQLTKGFVKATGRQPDNLEKLKIQQEAVQRFKEMNKVVDMQGRTLDPTKPIMGGTQEGAALKSGIMKATRAKPKKIDPENIADARLIDDMYRTAGPRNLDEDKMYLAEFIAEDAGKVLDDLPASEKKVFIDRAEKALKKNVKKYQDPEDMAQGGRAGFSKGKIVKEGLEGLAQLLKKEKARTQRMSGNLRLENMQRTEIGKPKKGVDYDYYRELLDDDENFIVMGDETEELLEAMVKEQEAEMAYMKRLYDKGALNPTAGETTMGRLKMLEDKAQKGEALSVDEIAEIKRLSEIFNKADGGRIGLKDGMSRRKFMKIMGGLAALPIVGKFFKAGKVAAPTVEKVIEKASTSDVPPYFLNLVNKIKNLGQKFDGPTERSESFLYKDYSMDIDLDTGKIDIKKTREAMIPGGDEAGIAEEVYMTYKPGMADETIKGKKVVDEYEEFTARPDMDGKMKDVDEGVPDEVIEEGTMFEDNMTEFGKASGGIARMLGE